METPSVVSQLGLKSLGAVSSVVGRLRVAKRIGARGISCAWLMEAGIFFLLETYRGIQSFSRVHLVWLLLERREVLVGLLSLCVGSVAVARPLALA